jgi:hypothetical protein
MMEGTLQGGFIQLYEEILNRCPQIKPLREQHIIGSRVTNRESLLWFISRPGYMSIYHITGRNIKQSREIVLWFINVMLAKMLPIASWNEISHLYSSLAWGKHWEALLAIKKIDPQWQEHIELTIISGTHKMLKWYIKDHQDRTVYLLKKIIRSEKKAWECLDKCFRYLSTQTTWRGRKIAKWVIRNKMFEWADLLEETGFDLRPAIAQAQDNQQWKDSLTLEEKEAFEVLTRVKE